MKKNNKVGFLSRNSINSQKVYKRWAEAGREIGLDVYFISITKQNLLLLKKQGKLKVIIWKNKSFSYETIDCPKAIYDRSPLGSKRNDLVEAMIEFMESIDVEFINSRSFRKFCVDKWKVAKFFEDEGINTPKTKLFSIKTLIEMIQEYKVIFVKNRFGAGGIGQYVLFREKNTVCIKDRNCEKKLRINSKSFTERLTGYFSQKKVGIDYIIQEGINCDHYESRFYDFRILYHLNPNQFNSWNQNATYIRVAAVNKVHSNIKLGGHSQDPKLFFEDYDKNIKPEIDVMCNTILKKLSQYFNPIGEIAIDLIFDQNSNLLCLELNSLPGYSGIRSLSELDPNQEESKMLNFEGYNNETRRKWGKIYDNVLKAPLLIARKMLTLN